MEISCRSIYFWTITAEIHARSLANFYCQYPDRHINLKFMWRVSEREPAIRQFVIVKTQICPEMQVNEMQALYDEHHKVSSFPKSHQNTYNSVKYEVIWKWHLVKLIYNVHWISLTCISGHKWKNKLMSVFNASVPLLIMNFVMTLSK